MQTTVQYAEHQEVQATGRAQNDRKFYEKDKMNGEDEWRSPFSVGV